MAAAETIAEGPIERSALTYHGQAYWCTGFIPYTRKRDCSRTLLFTWRSSCLACTRDFECVTAAEGRFRPLRRCPECRGRRHQSPKAASGPTMPPPMRPGQRPFAPIAVYDERGR